MPISDLGLWDWGLPPAIRDARHNAIDKSVVKNIGNAISGIASLLAIIRDAEQDDTLKIITIAFFYIAIAWDIIATGFKLKELAEARLAADYRIKQAKANPPNPPPADFVAGIDGYDRLDPCQAWGSALWPSIFSWSAGLIFGSVGFFAANDVITATQRKIITAAGPAISKLFTSVDSDKRDAEIKALGNIDNEIVTPNDPKLTCSISNMCSGW